MIAAQAVIAAAVIVLMGVTNELCLDVASMPFLWMLPLAVYLLSFVVAFASGVIALLATAWRAGGAP